jgi:hypothetical protein
MKKLLLTLVAVAVSMSVYAQGTADFKNIGGKAVNNTLTGAPVAASATSGIVAGLYWAPLGTADDAAFQMVGASANFLGNGLFNGGTRTVPTTAPNGAVLLQVRAWETAFGNSYEAVSGNLVPQVVGGTSRLGLLGKSASFEGTLGNPTTTPPGTALNIAPLMPQFAVSVNVPEPSVIALGVLGAGALLLLRRRK